MPSTKLFVFVQWVIQRRTVLTRLTRPGLAILTVKQIKIFAKGKQDQLGFDIKLLGGGTMFIIIEIYLITHYI